MILALFLLATLLLHTKAAGTADLGNNQYVIYNRQYHKAKICQFGTNYNSIGTCEKELGPNTLWLLDPHPTKTGCYYVVNDQYNLFRLAIYKTTGVWIKVTNGAYGDAQLFRFSPTTDGYYNLISCYYTNYECKLAKYGTSVTDNAFACKDPPRATQEWKLVPRFTAQISTVDIFAFDNRQGSTSITKEISVTTGIEKSTTSSVSSTTTYSQSLEASVSKSGASATSKTEFSKSITKAFSETNSQSWSETQTMTFTIPAGKNFKVMQHATEFVGAIPGDGCTLNSDIKIFESTSNSFSDPDGFIINT